MTFGLSGFVFVAILCALGGALGHALISAGRQLGAEWIDLVAELEPVNFDALSAIARDYLDPRPGQISMETGEIWELVGGYEGLDRMNANAKIMLALAAYAQRWNFEEGVIVTERMRRDAILLRQAVRRVGWGLSPFSFLRSFRITIPFHVHQAVSAYYLMRQRLLALYQTSHIGLYPALADTL